MNTLTNTVRLCAKIVLATALGAAMLALPGCILAIGNDTVDGSAIAGSRRVRLSPEDRRTLPEISSISNLPTLRTRYADELCAMGPTTRVEDFQRVFPAARFVERKTLGPKDFDAYSLSLHERYRYAGKDYGVDAHDEMWFCFQNGVLVKQGPANVWP